MSELGRSKYFNFWEYKQILKNNGFILVRQSGDHFIFKRGADTIVTTPKPNKMIVRRMIKTYNLKI